MEPNQVISYLFYAAMTLIGTYLSTTIAKLRDSVEKLNIVLASEVVKIENLNEKIIKIEHDIDKFETRIIAVELKSYNCPVGGCSSLKNHA